MHIEKHVRPIMWFNLFYITLLGLYAVRQKNYEFLFYVAIVIFFFLLLIKKYKKIGLSKGSLWRLSIWGLLHMMGGNIPVDGSVLYNLQLIPVILKYDQLVHAFGFGTTAIVGWELLKPYLNHKRNWTTLLILVVMIAMGAGALNEVIEFIATVLIPETNVGGYVNTALDLVFNLIGAIIAAMWIYRKER